MIKKYKTKFCEIEAVEWNGNNIKEVLVFMNKLPHVDYLPELEGYNEIEFKKWIFNQIDSNNKITIKTLEGDMKADIGDFIIKGLKGEFYPCKPDIFYQKYEEIEYYTEKDTTSKQKESTIKKENIPCEIDICMCSNSYSIKINKQWLCKEHMQELLNYLQEEFDKISKDDN